MSCVVTIAGFAKSGAPLFDLIVTIPEDEPDEFGPVPPTPAQRAAVEKFYHFDASNLSADQCHIMLCCRDYGWACVEYSYPVRPYKWQRKFALFVAVWLLDREDRREAASRWSRHRFQNGIEINDADRFPYYQQARLQCARIWRDLTRAGCDLEDHLG